MQTVDQPPLEDEASLFSLGSEFLEAAKILEATPVVKMNVSLVAYYLAGHASELLLKSYLFQSGISLRDLKFKLCHNLSQLISEARANGLPGSLQLDLVDKLSEHYKPKNTEYRQLATASYPPLDLLLAQVQALERQVFNHVAYFTNHREADATRD